MQEQQILKCICIIIILFTTLFPNLTMVFSESTGYSVINSQTLLESNTLDTLTLNYTKLPNVSVTGSEKYIVSDVQSVANSELTVREVKFPNATKRKNS